MDKVIATAAEAVAGVGCVQRIITDLDVTPEGLRLVETAPAVTPFDVRAATAAQGIVPERV